MKFGDVVSLVRNGVTVNALVISAAIINGEEQLRVSYLDPARAGESGSNVPSKQEFSVPRMKNGAVIGWKETTDEPLETTPEATPKGDFVPVMTGTTPEHHGVLRNSEGIFRVPLNGGQVQITTETQPGTFTEVQQFVEQLKSERDLTPVDGYVPEGSSDCIGTVSRTRRDHATRCRWPRTGRAES